MSGQEYTKLTHEEHVLQLPDTYIGDIEQNDINIWFYDDKDKKGLEDDWYAKIQFVHPPRNNGPTAMDGVSQVAWKENKDMSGELLSKVKRNNKIMIEFKGSATVSRAD